jgi:hypothetical protein
MSAGVQHNWEGRGFWTEAREKRLKELVATGASFSEIGKTLGTTRNAALAKSHRMGLKQPANAWAPCGGRQGRSGDLRAPPVKRNRHNGGMHMKAQKLARPALAVAGNGAVFERAPDAPAVATNVWQPLPDIPPVCILDLKHSHCRWPVDLAGADFPHACGALAIGGLYCIPHAKLSRAAAQPAGKGADKGLIRSVRRYAA